MVHLGRNFRRESYKALSNEPSFYAPLTHNLLLTKGQGVATFTRATIATYTDFEGLMKTAKISEVRFEGARRVENGIATRSADASGGGGWAYIGGATVAVGGAVTWTAGSFFYNLSNIPVKANQVMVLSFTASSATATTLIVRVDRNVIPQGNQQTYTISSTPKRYSFKATLDSNTTNVPVPRFDYGNGNVVITGIQIEDVTGQANQNPSEYVSVGVVSAPLYHGLGVDGVKDFTTLNGNSVASNVVTEATGSAIPESTLKGVMIEVASTNIFTQSGDISNANWVKTASLVIPVVTANISTGIQGGLTASRVVYPIVTGANYSIVYQQKTGQSAFIHLKGAVGGERVYLMSTVSGGTFFKKECILTTAWQKFELNNSVSALTYWQIGIDLRDATQVATTSIQTIYVDACQCEALPYTTSYIPTTTATVTRNADVLTFPNAGNVSDTAGTVLMDVTPAFDVPNSGTIGHGYQYIIDFASSFGAIFTTNNTLRRFDGTTTVTTPDWTPLKNTTYKIGSRYGSVGQRNWLNGTAGTNGAFDGSINSDANMSIGGVTFGTTYNWGGNIKNLKIYKRQLTDYQITYITDPMGNFDFSKADNSIYEILL